MTRLTTLAKKELLEKRLAIFKLDKTNKIVTDQINGKTFAIAKKTDENSLEVLTDFMTYEEMGAYFFGYTHGTQRLLETNQVDEKADVIKAIKDIVEQWGEFQMSEDCLEGEGAITVNEIGDTVSSIYGFGYDGVDCDIYVNDIETDSESYDYEDLELDILNEIYRLAEIYDTDSEKTFKRCQD